MDLLDNVIQPYAWGSRTAIAELLGQPSPAASCQAELWMGAHPGAPSRVNRPTGGVTLLEAIRAAPARELGEQVTRRFGAELPFLLKVLAAETPLSLQTHPSLAQAREGYARENALGVPPGAPHRNYKDANHKPELHLRADAVRCALWLPRRGRDARALRCTRPGRPRAAARPAACVARCPGRRAHVRGADDAPSRVAQAPGGRGGLRLWRAGRAGRPLRRGAAVGRAAR
ncbi:type I phosphomannose isomerase catalytic subunit [Archangium gephyra]|uniref:type I phosphomannose isomerase catalytic subunit n=1 Tax=Archangium gephyra TaxID=48 RepID=UPI003B7AF75D